MAGRKMEHVGIIVKDLDISIDFYCNIVGMTLKDRFDHPNGVTKLAFLGFDQEDESEVELIERQDADFPAEGKVHHVAFTVADIEAEFERISQLAAVKKRDEQITSLPNGARYFFFFGPDGELVEFFQPGNAAQAPSRSVDARELDENMRLDAIEHEGIAWYSPLDKPFRIAGFAWLDQDQVYRRLPVQPQYPIREPVNYLADCTAGGQIHFKTTSKKLMIRVWLNGPANMDHMPATGQCGFDCYIGTPGEQRYYSTVRHDHSHSQYEAILFDFSESEMREITLNFPLYQGVHRVEIGIEEAAKLYEPSAYAQAHKLIFYGTSITQGGCASRPGMAYPNILSRALNQEIINLGFSGNGKGEPELAMLITQIEQPGCLVLDYEANVGSTEEFAETLPAFIQIYREKHPHVPIIVVSRIAFSMDAFNTELRKLREERKSMQQATVSSLQQSGDQQIYFFDGASLLGPAFEECTVDGIHPTDLGFMRMAEGLLPFLKEVLSRSY